MESQKKALIKELNSSFGAIIKYVEQQRVNIESIILKDYNDRATDLLYNSDVEMMEWVEFTVKDIIHKY